MTNFLQVVSFDPLLIENTTPGTVPGPTGPQGPPGPPGTGSGAGLPSNRVQITAAYTALAGDFVEANTSTGGYTVALPLSPAVGALDAVKKVSSDTNTLTIAASGGGTIDGSSTLTTVTQWAGVVLEHMGSNVWRVAASMSTTGPAGANGTNGTNGTNGSNGTNGAISLIQDEGTGLTVRPTINFVGAGVTATDDAVNTRTLVTIPGGGGSGALLPLRPPSGYWFSPCPYIATGGGVTYTAGQIEFSPLLISTSVTVTDIMFKISVGVAGSTHRVGIYGDTNGLPGSLVVDLGSVATATAALLGYTGLTQVLAPGNYWLAIVQQGSGVSTLWKGGQLPYIADSRANGQFILDSPPPVAFNSSATTFTGALPSTAPTLATATSAFAARFALKAA